jgi:hypothetical protein
VIRGGHSPRWASERGKIIIIIIIVENDNEDATWTGHNRPDFEMDEPSRFVTPVSISTS